MHTFKLETLVSWRSFFNVFTATIGSLAQRQQTNFKGKSKFGDELCNVITMHIDLYNEKQKKNIVSGATRTSGISLANGAEQ